MLVVIDASVSTYRCDMFQSISIEKNEQYLYYGTRIFPFLFTIMLANNYLLLIIHHQLVSITIYLPCEYYDLLAWYGVSIRI